MTKVEAIENINAIRKYYLQNFGEDTVIKVPIDGDDMRALDMAIKALEAEPCEDAISRQAVIEKIYWLGLDHDTAVMCDLAIRAMSPVQLSRPTGHCKDCKYIEYDRMAMMDGIPIIVAHEICSRWGDGCKTKEDGYCFLFEPKESEEQA